MENLNIKRTLDSKQLQLLSTEMDQKKKSLAVAWLLWFFLGGFGGHRYYAGKIKTGVAMTLTLGGLGIWAFIDAIFVNKLIQTKNSEIETQIIAQIQQTA